MRLVRGMRGWGTILPVGGLPLAALLALAALPPGLARAEVARAATLAPEAPLGVQIITAKLSEDRKTLTLTGEIAARDTLSASFPTSGRITEMRASRGDHVKQGDELARIDSVQQEEGLRSAQATLASAQAALTKARDDATRQDNLLATGATTRSARDSAADDLRAAEATVAQASADLDRAKKALSDTVLLAPADATVTDRMAEVGQVVSAAQPVLELALGNRFDAIFQVPEVSLATAPRTIPVITLWPVGQPDRPFTGTVREISPLVDATQGTVKVKVSVDSLPKGVGFGDAVVGQVSTKDAPRILLPWPALTATAKGPAVWLVDPKTHRVSLRQVKVLRYETGQIVLENGIAPGDLVVGLGANLLYPGREVQGVEVSQ